MATYKITNKDVMKMKDMPPGNTVPSGWYQTMKKTHNNNGEPMQDVPKPYNIAIDILAELCYWYRPVLLRNDKDLIKDYFEQKFEADLLQKDYNQLRDKFGYSKKQIKVACDYLEDIGAIKKHFRNVHDKQGNAVNNSLYIQLFPDMINLLAEPEKYAIYREREGLSPIPTHTTRTGGMAIPPERDTSSLTNGMDDTPRTAGTNTKTTTEITTKTTEEGEPSAHAPQKSKEKSKELTNNILENNLGEQLETNGFIEDFPYENLDAKGNTEEKSIKKRPKWMIPKEGYEKEMLTAVGRKYFKFSADSSRVKKILKQAFPFALLPEGIMPNEWIEFGIAWARKKNKFHNGRIGVHAIKISSLCTFLEDNDHKLEWTTRERNKGNLEISAKTDGEQRHQEWLDDQKEQTDGIDSSLVADNKRREQAWLDDQEEQSL